MKDSKSAIRQIQMTPEEVAEACRLWLQKKGKYPPRSISPHHLTTLIWEWKDVSVSVSDV